MADWTSSVRSYLRETLLTVPGLPAVAYEGMAYTPIIGTQWLREQLQPVAASVETLGGNGQVREDFNYRLTLFSPLGSRLTNHDNLIDGIRAKFYPGQEIRDMSSRYSGIVVEARRGVTVTEPDWIGTAIIITGYFHRATSAA